MIFRQFNQAISGALSYLVADKPGGHAVVIDPVGPCIDDYLQLIRELNVSLAYILETHSHRSDVSSSMTLRDQAGGRILMGEKSTAEWVDEYLHEGDRLIVGELAFFILNTPGHTADSCCYLLEDRVFTGDTLLVRSTGRTDLASGDAEAQYDSIVNKLYRLPDEMKVYPAHAYGSQTSSTVDEERWHNPRLHVENKADYVSQMAALRYEDEDLMDAVAREPVIRFI